MNTSPGTPGDRLLDYSNDRLVAVFDAGPDQATLDDLAASGFTQSLDVMCGPAGARLIDFSGTEHGPFARLSHALHHLMGEGELMDRYERELLAGHCVVMVLAEGDERQLRAAEIMRAHGGRFMNQFGTWTVETVHP